MKIKVVGKVGRRDPLVFEYAPGYAFTHDVSCRSYDWLVVYDDLPQVERLACPREHTILMTSEPTSIKGYSGAYVRQFGHLLTNRPPSAENHPNYHLGRGYYRWLNGRTYAENRDAVIPPKTQLISAVCSSKQMRLTRHFERFKLISELAKRIPGFEWYGRGVRAFGKKFEVMDVCKYHVAVENHIAPHHWSEKIADAILCECLPFYAGAPDLAEDLPADSFIPIPIDDADEAVRIIRTAMANNEYERRLDVLREAKRLLLTRYNFWAQIIEVIDSCPSPASSSADGTEILYDRKNLRRRYPVAALEDGWWHLRQAFGLMSGRSEKWYNVGKGS